MEKAAATVTIHRAAEMTPKGRKKIVAWLKRQATFLEHDYEQLGPRYVAKWLYKV